MATQMKLTTVEFSNEELATLVAWMAVIGFQGTAQELEKPLAMMKTLTGKLEAAQAQSGQRKEVQEEKQES